MGFFLIIAAIGATQMEQYHLSKLEYDDACGYWCDAACWLAQAAGQCLPGCNHLTALCNRPTASPAIPG